MYPIYFKSAINKICPIFSDLMLEFSSIQSFLCSFVAFPLESDGKIFCAFKYLTELRVN